jgi:hypothetical protein
MTKPKPEKVGMKHRLVHELRRLVGIFLYLAVFFTTLRLYTRLMLAEYRIDSFAYGLTLLKSLALAKVILTGEALRLGERFRDRPLIVPTFYKSLIFSAFALAFEVVEHLLLDWIHGRSPGEVLAELLAHGWPHLLAMTMVVFVAFLPFFAVGETERVLGEYKLHELFFRRPAPAGAGEPLPAHASDGTPGEEPVGKTYNRGGGL